LDEAGITVGNRDGDSRRDERSATARYESAVDACEQVVAGIAGVLSPGEREVRIDSVNADVELDGREASEAGRRDVEALRGVA